MLAILNIIGALMALAPELEADLTTVMPIIEAILGGQQVTEAQMAELDSVGQALSDQAAAKAAQLET